MNRSIPSTSALPTIAAATVLAIITFLHLPPLPATAGDRVTNMTVLPTPDRGEPIVAQTDSDGTIHLLYNAPDGPRYAKSTDNGKSFAAAIPVVAGQVLHIRRILRKQADAVARGPTDGEGRHEQRGDQSTGP